MAIISMLFYSSFNKRLKPISLALASSMASNQVTFMINDAVNEHFAKGDFNYETIYMVVKNNSGEIASLTPNLIKINQIKSDLTQEILDKIDDIELGTIFIPIGNLLGTDLLANRGFRLPIELLSAGSLDVSFSDSFTHAGINQTRHEISLSITGDVTVILPTGNASEQVSVTLPVAQTIIVGRVPNTYTNLQVNDAEALNDLPYEYAPVD